MSAQNQPFELEVLTSLPGAQKKSERSAWYPLFMHARFPRFSWGTWKLTGILVHVAQPYITESWESLHLIIQQSCVMCPWQGWKAKNGTEGVCMVLTDTAGTHVGGSYSSYSCLTSTLKWQKWHNIANTALQAVWCSCTL